MDEHRLPISKEMLENVVHERARDSANVVITEHCLQCMEEREITYVEAIRCVRRGRIVASSLVYDEQHGSWKFKIQEDPPRDIVCLVAAVQLDPASRQVIAITVWEI